MAALEEGNAARKIGARAAQSAANALNGASPGLREVGKTDRVSLPGPAAAGIAMQLSGNPALQARFHRLEKQSASNLKAATSPGHDLPTLLPAALGAEVPGL